MAVDILVVQPVMDVKTIVQQIVNVPVPGGCDRNCFGSCKTSCMGECYTTCQYECKGTCAAQGANDNKYNNAER